MAEPLAIAREVTRGRGLRRKRLAARRADGATSPTTRRIVPDQRPALALGPLIAEFSATFGSAWGPITRRKHRDDFARFIAWLESSGRPATTRSLDVATLAAFVADLRTRPKVSGVWRGAPDARERSLRHGTADKELDVRPGKDLGNGDVGASIVKGDARCECGCRNADAAVLRLGVLERVAPGEHTARLPEPELVTPGH